VARVLIIDDTEADRRLLRSLLVHLGHGVREAREATEGLNLARRDHPDLIISDVLMPATDGFQLAHEVRSDPGLAGTRVVLTTARTLDRRTQELARKCGVSHIIPKPCEPVEILRIVDAVLAVQPTPTPASLDTVGTEHLSLLSDALFQKVEELKQVNRDLRDSESRFRTLVEVAPNAIVGSDARGRITLVNALTERLFGYERSELLGRPIEVLLPPEFHRAHVTDRQAYLRDPGMRPMGAGREVFGVTRDGRRFPVSVTLSTVGSGDDVTVLAAVNDLTDRVRSERERVQLEKQLHQLQRLESVGQLAGGIAHDFNNLLAVILNYASFVSESVEAGSELHGDVCQIIAAAERAAGLTRQLLLFSRMEPTEVQNLDLNEVAGEMRALLRRTIGEDVEIRTELAERVAVVAMDRTQLDQVLMNLVLNARDAMADGGSITIETAMADVDDREEWPSLELAPGRYVRLSVTDTGTGMTRETMARALEPFFTTKPRGEGTGLGLAMVYGVVTKAGGGVHLYSEPGLGTTVTVYLPAVAGEASAGTGEGLHRPGTGERVLVVEDEDAVREIVRRVLTRNGYEVVTAATPSDALALAEQVASPELVISDVVMPEMSGLALAERLHEHWPGVPVLFMSGYPSDLRARRMGADVPMIRKPFGQSALLGSVRELIDRQG
jgi:PAS domain S-box-containing protein